MIMTFLTFFVINILRNGSKGEYSTIVTSPFHNILMLNISSNSSNKLENKNRHTACSLYTARL